MAVSTVTGAAAASSVSEKARSGASDVVDSAPMSRVADSAVIGSLLALLVAACAGGQVGSACVASAECTQSFCNGTWAEGGHCEKDADCPGYEAAAGGYRPRAPNKRCIGNVCHQVGRCSTDHS